MFVLIPKRHLVRMSGQNKSLLDKFRGCLVGALVGDCIGDTFEYQRADAGNLKTYIDNTERLEEKDLKYTDDTQMTQELAKSLIACNGINHADLAKRFTERYYLDGRSAGYGANVVDVFKKLKATHYLNPLDPAREQFGGTGSFANGASMRVAPVPLFAYPSIERTAELAEQQALVTHYHQLGRHGAIFQAVAIQKVLAGPFDNPQTFVDDLKTTLTDLQLSENFLDLLDIIKKFLADPPKIAEVVQKLGNGVAARRSVPTALYCFLRSTDFRSAIEYAVSLGGDTDTIASMAGALAGAFYGLEAMNPNTVQSCPDIPVTLKLADDLYAIAVKEQ